MSSTTLTTHRSIVVGAGSIGIRHHRVLQHLGSTVATVSRRPEAGDYRTVSAALASGHPNYVVIATETERHLESLESLIDCGYSGQVLLEKPILDQPVPLPTLPFSSISVGYHLRFHPAVRQLRSALDSTQVLSAQVRYGQYLPDWRPGRDYRETVTAGPGGGVLLELSHELDLIQWLLGPAEVIQGRTVSSGLFDMEREDLAVGLLYLQSGGLVSLELNCLDRVQNRTMTVTTSDHFFRLDLISGSLERDGETICHHPVARDDVFTSMHRAAIARQPDMCTVDEAMAVLYLVEDLRVP